MPIALTSRIRQGIEPARHAYFRLVLVVGPSGAGKSRAIRVVADECDAPVLNLGLTLSERLVGLSRQQLALRTGDVLSELADTVGESMLVLDNIEVLFHPALRQNPLPLLQSLSRTRLVLASWAGGVAGEDLTYAEPGHPEYRRYPRPDAILISTTTAG